MRIYSIDIANSRNVHQNINDRIDAYNESSNYLCLGFGLDKLFIRGAFLRKTICLHEMTEDFQ